jgi:hypothetical protein
MQTPEQLAPAASYIVAPLNTPAATAFHQQAQQALPAGLRADTGGGSTTGRVSATVYDGPREVAFCHGTAPDVLDQLERLPFPATDAFLRLESDYTNANVGDL